ncbi:melanophilin-like isoform X2 [Polyodon spathula]|uniref:melanophilin-like isoform X2 n=1 Tax=Polyodon spathula TaxID=7913 RepID=UPI001B7E5AED|nr:melanophilin-like isoform X2 [Polyodon spathula]
MISGTMGKKLDLSKLTDEEAKHVWEVIQRDFDLRKKEEDRLGELKTKLEKEDTKLELLGTQSSLTDSHCIRCLQPFKFLMNSKRQCLDCRLYTCKSCSRYNKKERGWVCDPCRTSRVVKMGSLDWYHEHVRSRFKRFGSAKVMRSLYKRLHSEQRLKSELAGSHDDNTYSMPDVRDMYDMPEEDEVTIDASEAQRYRLMRKTKRLLSVHPLDFDLDSEYSTQSRRQSLQHSGGGEGVTRKESMIAEADIASMFQQILQEQGQVGGKPEQEFSTEVHLRINSRRKSLEKSSKSDEGHFSEHRMIRARPSPKGSPTGQLKGPQRSQYYADMDSSDEQGEGVPRFPLYQNHFPKRRSRASSQEMSHHSKPQISELNKRMSAIERLLNRLEQRIVVPSEQGMQSDADLEEKKLKKKLGELAGNISDKGLSSEEDEGRKKKVQREAMMSSSSDDLPNEAQKRSAATLCDITTEALRTLNATERAISELVPPKPKERQQLQGTDVTRADEAYRELEQHVYMAASKTYSLEKKLKDLEESAKSRYSGTTDSELSELEDKVAYAAAAVQNTESEVSDIENRIAALSAAGLTVVPERNRKKFSGQTVATQQSVRRKLSNSHLNQRETDEFDRNALYKGSLTQRTPAFMVKRNAAYAETIMAQHP